MSFDFPLLLLLAPFVALAFVAGAWVTRWRRIRLARAWSDGLGRAAGGRGRWAPAAIGVAALLAAVAVAGPRAGRTEVTARSSALSLVLAMDISRSMLAEDVPPNRLQHAVQEARRLVQDLPNDRIGLIAFAGRSYILAPLTVDGSAVRMYLDALDPDLASQGGTSLSSVLTQGRELLSATEQVGDRVLVLFTDGETHDTLPEALAQAAALRKAGIQLVLVGEGGVDPARIPVRDSSGALQRYQLDAEGMVIRTQRRDDVLRALADAADGTLISAELPDQAGAVRNLASTLERSPTSETRTADLVPRAWIGALLAALVLLVHTMTRRGAALVSVTLALTLPGAASPAAAQRPTSGERALAAGDLARAAAEFLREAHDAASARDTAFYNAGTAALRAGRLEVARGALAEAAKSIDPALRYRALYNLGLAALLDAEADSGRRDTLLSEATARLKEALLLEPSSERAKWNLELAQRRHPPPPQPTNKGGGGGGAGSQAPSPGGDPRTAPPPPGAAGISRSQAEQILNSMEREERATRVERQRRLRGTGAGGVKDW